MRILDYIQEQPIDKVFFLFILALCVSGCSNMLDNMSMRGETLELPVQEIIPTDWRPFGSLRDINIDGDEQIERLLLYSFDNNPGDTSAEGMGPIGALIYDIQSEANFVTGNQQREYYPIPNQPSAFYVPYRILPNYWESIIGQSGLTSMDKRLSFPHFVALPDVRRDTDIVVQRVTPSVAEDLDLNDNNSAQGDGPKAELIIRGGKTHITIVWWKNVFDGYGVAQLHAPYGFIDEQHGIGVLGTNPIETVVGAFPENDRSRFCRRVLYSRRLVSDGVAHDPSPLAIQYDTTEMGLHFCDEIPFHPFYPEGVVLAYLHAPDSRGYLVESPFDNEFDTAALRAKLEERARLRPNERIETIYTRVELPHFGHRPIQGEQNLGRVEGGPTLAWQTNVCVELIESTAETRGSYRQLRFRLQHQPPSLEANQTDRWFIMDLVPEIEIQDNLTCQGFIQKLPPRQ